MDPWDEWVKLYRRPLLADMERLMEQAEKEVTEAFKEIEDLSKEMTEERGFQTAPLVGFTGFSCAYTQ